MDIQDNKNGQIEQNAAPTYISVHCYQHLAKTIKRVTDTQFLLQKNNNTNNHNVIHETHKYVPVYIKFIFSNLINDSLVRQLLYITVLKRTWTSHIPPPPSSQLINPILYIYLHQTPLSHTYIPLTYPQKTNIYQQI